MPNIAVLDQNTINKIAAGEVVERPAAVIKELLENAIDAKATAVTVEIKDGGLSFIRVTDNGGGIPKEEIPLAFLRHATSKIRSAADLLTVSSLGFRGEALASIAAVSQVELITKTQDSFTGFRYQIEGGAEKSLEEVGAPDGTTLIVRNLFFNTPARKKFLKTAATEGSHVANLVEKIALSRPDISVRFIQNNQNKLYTSGNHNLRDVIYTIYGREIAANLLPVEEVIGDIAVSGWIGKPVIARNNRNFENYFINNRYIKNNIITRAVEDAYQSFLMQHKYPFILLHFTMEPESLDVNVHPAKMELRFQDGESVYRVVYQAISHALAHQELIPRAELKAPDNLARKEEEKEKQQLRALSPEPFEKKRLGLYEQTLKQLTSVPEGGFVAEEGGIFQRDRERKLNPLRLEQSEREAKKTDGQKQEMDQMELFDDKFLGKKAREQHKLIGQLFGTYWLVEYNRQLFIIDQHAAHEKILFEKTMASLKTSVFGTQMVDPPVILSLSATEEVLINQYMKYFQGLGFEIEHFGGHEYALRGVPANLLSIAKKDLFLELLNKLSEDTQDVQSDIVYEKVASLSCKAAVKGNHLMSAAEADALIGQLLETENPYTCPHGRPTIVSMSQYELEKKFKRII